MELPDWQTELLCSVQVRPGPGELCCLLCGAGVDTVEYSVHLQQQHAVLCNLQFLLACTQRPQQGQEETSPLNHLTTDDHEDVADGECNQIWDPESLRKFVLSAMGKKCLVSIPKEDMSRYIDLLHDLKSPVKANNLECSIIDFPSSSSPLNSEFIEGEEEQMSDPDVESLDSTADSSSHRKRDLSPRDSKKSKKIKTPVEDSEDFNMNCYVKIHKEDLSVHLSTIDPLSLNFGFEPEESISTNREGARLKSEKSISCAQNIDETKAKTIPRNADVMRDVSSDKNFSDNYDDSCIIKCAICFKKLYPKELRKHTKKEHSLDIKAYKLKFGTEFMYLRKCFHKCKICGKELLLEQDTIASHARFVHKLSSKEYNDQYMTMKRNTPTKENRSDLEQSVPRSPRILKRSKEAALQNGSSYMNQIEMINGRECKWLDEKTSQEYECKICSKKLSSSKAAIGDHLQSQHFLNLKKYEELYELKIMTLLSERRLKESPSQKGDENQDMDNKHLNTIIKCENTQTAELNRNDDPSRETKSNNFGKKGPDIGTLKSREDVNGHKEGCQESFSENAENYNLDSADNYNLDSAESTVEKGGKVGKLGAPGIIEIKVNPVVDIEVSCRPDWTSEETVRLTEQLLATTTTPPQELTTTTTNKGESAELPKEPSTDKVDEIYVYLCPFPACEYTADFKVKSSHLQPSSIHNLNCDFPLTTAIIIYLQALKFGSAAAHCSSVHNTAPTTIKTLGYKWKKVTLEARMSSMFGEDYL